VHRTDEGRTADLLRQGSVMAAVTASAERVPGCTVERLGRMRYRPTAAPTFTQRWFPDGVTPEALSCAPIVVFDRHDRMQDRYLQRRTRRRLDPPRHHIPGSADFLEAVRLGLGWGMIPDLQVTPGRDDLRVIDPHGSIDVRLFWQQWRLQSPVLERVTAAVRAAAGTALR
jgi:LysR family transcriptional regulator (chromosome initiation inhibitor)